MQLRANHILFSERRTKGWKTEGDTTGSRERCANSLGGMFAIIRAKEQHDVLITQLHTTLLV